MKTGMDYINIPVRSCQLR